MVQATHRKAAWLRRLLASRRHQPLRHPAAPTAPPALPLLVAPHDPPHLPAQRRKFAEPIDGDATRLVRPYIVEHEQSERRRAPALALDGIYVGPYWIHGVEVAR